MKCIAGFRFRGRKNDIDPDTIQCSDIVIDDIGDTYAYGPSYMYQIGHGSYSIAIPPSNHSTIDTIGATYPNLKPLIKYRSTCKCCGAPINENGKCEYCGVGNQYLEE